MITSLDIVTTVCVALLIGNEISVSAFIDPILWKLEERAQAKTVSLFAGRLGAAMPFWYALSLVLLVVETFVHREAGFFLLSVSCAIWVVVVLLTLLFMVPINNRLARMEAGHREHRRWDRFHRLRILALGTSLVCFLLAIRRI
jgi:hypothetical protein